MMRSARRSRDAAPVGTTTYNRMTAIMRDYEIALRSVGTQVGRIIRGYPAGDPSFLPSIMDLLNAYAHALEPWAAQRAGAMIQQVNIAEMSSWRALGKVISVSLAREIKSTPVGHVMRGLMNEQVTLIKSLPTEAGQRVHDLTMKAQLDSGRYQEIIDDIHRSGEVTRSRATLIARTETSRTGTVLTQSRCEHNGFPSYIWRTAEDSTVRPGHAAMEGKVCEWSNPPGVKENGKIMHFHPGSIWNCRCYAEPVIT